MKRLAVGIVLFTSSFLIPAPGSADLVFLTRDLGKSLNAIENGSKDYSSAGSGSRIVTENTALSRATFGAASQQLASPAQADSRLTPLLYWPVLPAPGQPVSLSDGEERSPAMPEFAEWLLVLAGFALAGVAIRNRSSSRLDDRNPSFSRLPLDI